MVLEGSLIHHLEVSKQGFVLPFKTIGELTLYSYFTIQNHNTEWFQIGGLMKFLRWVNSWFDFDLIPFKSIQMVLEGPLIHHLEVSKQGFV